jgi:hypothetical protein
MKNAVFWDVPPCGLIINQHPRRQFFITQEIVYTMHRLICLHIHTRNSSISAAGVSL